MSEICIVEVNTKAELRKFVDVPNVMYRDVPEYVPAFYGDDPDDWDKSKNPAFKYCEARAFLAYKDNQIVGIIRLSYHYFEPLLYAFLTTSL